MKLLRFVCCLAIFTAASLGLKAQLPVLIYGDTVLASQASTFNVPIRVKHFSGIYHMSSTITWDPAVISFNNVNSYGLAFMNGTSFNLTNASTGQIALNWFHQISLGQSVPDTTIIFKLNFTAVGPNNSTTRIRFLDSPQIAMWYHWSGNQGALDTLPGKVTIGCALPQTSFTSTPSNLSIAFQDNSQPVGSSWFWTFGDGGTSTLHNPTHVYATTGTYNVCLISTNACGADTTCQNITVTCAPPAAAFTQTATLLNATFANNSTGFPTAWSWDFGDGGTSTLQNPTHTYATPGTYTVCMTATNPCGSNNTCHPVTVTCPLPVASFGFTANSLVITFNNSSGNSNAWHWDFGDGGLSTAQNPSHTYAQPGIYQVCLISTNSCGNDTGCTSITVGCPAPGAAFTSTVSTLSVLFTDNTSGGANAWFWTFGDGGTANTQFPVHTYATEGTYQVCLIATSLCGSDTLCDSVTIVCPAPGAAFSTNVNAFAVSCTDLSTNAPTTWDWDFGDGGTSSLQNPSHTYAQNGNYAICLRTTNQCGTDSTCDTLNISVLGAAPDLLQAIRCYPNPTNEAMAILFPEGISGMVQLEMRDAMGRLVWSDVVPASETAQIDMSHVAKGIYCLRIQTADGQVLGRMIERQ